MKALALAQKNEGTLQNALNETRAQLADTRNELKMIKASMSKKSRGAPKDPKAEAIKAAGRKFGTLYDLWISTPFFAVAKIRRPSSDVSLSGNARYLNEKTKRDALLTEVYSVVPAEYHEFLSSSPKLFGRYVSLSLSRRLDLISICLFSKFVAGVGAQRTQCVNLIKTAIARIYSVDVADALLKSKPSTDGNEADGEAGGEASAPEVLRALRGVHGTGGTRTNYPPVLYPQGHTGDVQYLFKCDIMVRVSSR